MQKRPLLKEVLQALGNQERPASRDQIVRVLNYHPIFAEDGLNRAVQLYSMGGWGIFEDLFQTADWFRTNEANISRDEQQLDVLLEKKQRQERRYGGEQ